MSDWIDTAARQIFDGYDSWESEAFQIAQNEQDTEAGRRHLIECIANKLRWLYANHSKETRKP